MCYHEQLTKSSIVLEIKLCTREHFVNEDERFLIQILIAKSMSNIHGMELAYEY